MTRGFLAIWLAALCATACGGTDNPGTSVELALIYDDALKLETAEVTLGTRTESGTIAHRMLLLVADDQAMKDMSIEVWGRKDGKRVAYGAATATPTRGQVVTATVTLAACSPGCDGDMLTTCTGPAITCEHGCSEDGDARCIVPMLSNGIDAAAAAKVAGTITIGGDTTFDVDTGAITGGVVRAAGARDGSDDGIGYLQAPPSAAGGPPLGVFVFHNLTVQSDVIVRFVGTRAAVLLIDDAAKINGTIDVAAGRGAMRGTPGPGGGAGGTTRAAAGGCGAGGKGDKAAPDDAEDSGGGGGGGGAAGGRGGNGLSNVDNTVVSPGGTAGKRCLAEDLQPLQGGSGGGAGSPGVSSEASRGGGGGGALQISALGSLQIGGAINASGAGGEVGFTDSSAIDSGGGAGGGSGGAILLEAPIVEITFDAVLAANGGGGGGAGSSLPGTSGENGRTSTTPARGGTTGSSTSPAPVSGGDGGAAVAAARPGSDLASNAGGGGGAIGAIVIRGTMRMLDGTITPAPAELALLQ